MEEHVQRSWHYERASDKISSALEVLCQRSLPTAAHAHCSGAHREKLSLPGARDRLQHLVDATVAVENLRRSVLSRAVAIQEQLEHLRSVLKPEQVKAKLSLVHVFPPP